MKYVLVIGLMLTLNGCYSIKHTIDPSYDPPSHYHHLKDPYLIGFKEKVVL